MTSILQHRILSIGQRVASAALALAVVLALTLVATQRAQAQTFSVLYSFTGGADGAFPTGALLLDGAGNLYGNTYYGGDLTCGPPDGCGTVFKLDRSGKEKVPHSFTAGADGVAPQGALVRDAAGNLYGTTPYGGTAGYGTVFKLDTSGMERVLHSFTGRDGTWPSAGLVWDEAGNLYGTTSSGNTGATNYGTVFKLDPTSRLTTLYRFTGRADGEFPAAELIRDKAGNLYGTTISGQDPYSVFGAVYMLDTSGTVQVLGTFTGGADGGNPYAGLVRDAAGNLYGTTANGGASGYGTVFKLEYLLGGTAIVLHTFTGGADGGNPYAGLVRDAAGNLYGTTAHGGASGYGTVFKLDTSGTETVLHSFTGATDGAHPYEALVRDAAGNLYGTTAGGGAYGHGVVFKLAP